MTPQAVTMSSCPRYQTPASRRRQQQQPVATSTSASSSSSTTTFSSSSSAVRRSHSATLLRSAPAVRRSPVTCSASSSSSSPSSSSVWSHPPFDLVVAVFQFLPLPSLLSLSSLSHYHHLLLSHPLIWRSPTLSLSSHHSHHPLLSSLVSSSPCHSLFSRLQHVDLSHSLFSHSSLLFLSNCHALRSLKIHQSQFDPPTLTRLTSLLPPTLSSIQLSSLSLTPAILQTISTLPALTYVDLHSSKGMGGEEGEGWRWLSALRGVRELNLEGCEGLDDRAMRLLMGGQWQRHAEERQKGGEEEGEEEEKRPSGEEEEMGGSDGGEEGEEWGCVEVFPHLVSLRLSGPISDASLRLLARRCPQLTSLSLTACKLLTMQGVTALAASMLSLSSLGLARCPALFSPTPQHDSSFPASPPPFPAFPSLTLLTVSHLTNASLQSLLTSHPHLSHLAVSSPSLTSAAFPLLLEHGRLRELGLGLWGGKGRRDVLFSHRVREVMRRWGKEVRGAMVMIEGEREVRGMVEEIVRGMEREEGGEGWKEENEEEVDERWRWTQTGRLRKLRAFC